MKNIASVRTCLWPCIFFARQANPISRSLWHNVTGNVRQVSMRYSILQTSTSYQLKLWARWVVWSSVRVLEPWNFHTYEIIIQLNVIKDFIIMFVAHQSCYKIKDFLTFCTKLFNFSNKLLPCLWVVHRHEILSWVPGDDLVYLWKVNTAEYF